MSNQENIGSLVEEYRVLLGDLDGPGRTVLDPERIQSAEWSPRAAEHLLDLARDYGSFMLRNALALSLALDIEDGELGF